MTDFEPEHAFGWKQFSTFFVADLYLGINVLRVQEVLQYLPMTRVPGAPAVIEGLINLRGQIITAIDLRRRLHLPPRDEREKPMNMVLRTEGGPVSLLVDRIGDVVDVDGASRTPPPQNLDPVLLEVVSSVYRMKDRLLLTLDSARVVDLSSGKF
jgi:purine-binding chemotaxis protein CheW